MVAPSCVMNGGAIMRQAYNVNCKKWTRHAHLTNTYMQIWIFLATKEWQRFKYDFSKIFLIFKMKKCPKYYVKQSTKNLISVLHCCSIFVILISKIIYKYKPCFEILLSFLQIFEQKHSRTSNPPTLFMDALMLARTFCSFSPSALPADGTGIISYTEKKLLIFWAFYQNWNSF